MRYRQLSKLFTVTTATASIFLGAAYRNRENKRPDFTGIAGVEKVYEHLKPKDAQALADLLQSIPLLKTTDTSKPLKVLDVGGADGWMLLSLMKLLNRGAMIDVCEPSKNPDRIEKYKNRVAQQSPSFQLNQVINNPIESPEVTLTSNSYDMILASHVLYYNPHSWFKANSLDQHLFTKLFRSLKNNGILCIVIQSIQPTNNMSKSGKTLFTHEQSEDFVYPLVDQVAHGDNPNYANAEQVRLALNFYEKSYIAQFGKKPEWNLQSKLAITPVPWGNVNFIPNENGEYEQSPEVNALLKFYLKGHELSSLPVDKQQKFLQLLQDHYQAPTGECVMTHVNEVYTIVIPKSMHQNLQKLGIDSKAEVDGSSPRCLMR